MFDDYCLEVVSGFQYVGSTVSEGPDEMEELRRITAGSRAYFVLNKSLKDRSVSRLRYVVITIRLVIV